MSAHGRDTDDDPAVALAQGFAQHIGRWAEACATQADAGTVGDTVALARRAAYALSLATSQGHVCLGLADLRAMLHADASPPELEAPSGPNPSGLRTAGRPPQQGGVGPAQAHIDLDTLRRHLLDSSVVGTPVAPRALPLLLDADDRLYLQRHFDYEQRLARRLLRAACAAPETPDARARAQLDALFAAGDSDGSVDWQKLAAALALRQRLVVISGGPGTGKTSTVVNLLACLLAQNPHLRIALAAPTGKAAARLGEAMVQRAATLPAPLRDKLPVAASTVHRLLGAGPGGFTHHAGQRLAIDVLVVDEASMLDLALATRLFEAVPEAARIVLLGDKDQLAAVESGAVFAELSADAQWSAACKDALAGLCGVPAQHIATGTALQASPLHDHVVWFTRNYRFGAASGIARAATDVRLGHAAALIERIGRGEEPDLRWLDDAHAMPAAATLDCMSEGFAPYLEAVQRVVVDPVTLLDGDDVAAVSKAFTQFRVLCALREGPRGVLAMNEHLSQWARARLVMPQGAARPDARSPWFAGRPVMVLRNDALLKLFNGDIGIALPGVEGELQVYFSDGAGGYRAVPPLRLPAHETAFAMTVHKAQGSEFEQLLVLLPAQRSRVLTRELLYTALTRARVGLVLAGGSAVLQAAIATPTQRRSGLLARLREEAAMLAASSSSGHP